MSSGLPRQRSAIRCAFSRRCASGRCFVAAQRPIVLTPAGAKLFPIVRNGFDAFSTALSEVKDEPIPQPLRVTTTNTFASRWLVPRLPLWRAAQPYIDLEIIGTDDVIDLHAADADVAIRYARSPAGRRCALPAHSCVLAGMANSAADLATMARHGARHRSRGAAGGRHGGSIVP
jgi:DNA-binding transcriptional LysR family regulator